MEKIIDLHNHLETLHSVLSFRNRLQGHLYSLKGHMKPDHKVILGVAFYIQPWQSYDDLVLQIKNFAQEIHDLGPEVKLITKKADLEDNYKVGCIFHIESARTLKNPEVQLPHLWELGIRGIIPIHFVDNYIGNSCDDVLRRLKIKKVDTGLTKEGKNFIQIMNDLGMWVDLSHTMDTTADQMLELAKHVMVSHVAIRDNVPKLRNKTINFLKNVADKGGIFGLIPWQHLIGPEQSSYQAAIQTCLDYNLQHAICIGTDLGAPVKTHPTIKSVFDCGKVAEQFTEHAQNIRWDNAYHFLSRVLPD